jgi:hypothetical protein
MSESFMQFFHDYPFLAVFIAVFMILPIIGAVIHIILKALGRRGIDNSPPSRFDFSAPEDKSDSNDIESSK